MTTTYNPIFCEGCGEATDLDADGFCCQSCRDTIIAEAAARAAIKVARADDMSFYIEPTEPITFVVIGISQDTIDQLPNVVDDLDPAECPAYTCDFFVDSTGYWCDGDVRVWRSQIDRGLTAMAMHRHPGDELLVVCGKHDLRIHDGQRWAIGTEQIDAVITGIVDTYHHEWQQGQS